MQTTCTPTDYLIKDDKNWVLHWALPTIKNVRRKFEIYFTLFWTALSLFLSLLSPSMDVDVLYRVTHIIHICPTFWNFSRK